MWSQCGQWKADEGLGVDVRFQKHEMTDLKLRLPRPGASLYQQIGRQNTPHIWPPMVPDKVFLNK